MGKWKKWFSEKATSLLRWIWYLEFKFQAIQLSQSTKENRGKAYHLPFFRGWKSIANIRVFFFSSSGKSRVNYVVSLAFMEQLSTNIAIRLRLSASFKLVCCLISFLIGFFIGLFISCQTLRWLPSDSVQSRKENPDLNKTRHKKWTSKGQGYLRVQMLLWTKLCVL